MFEWFSHLLLNHTDIKEYLARPLGGFCKGVREEGPTDRRPQGGTREGGPSSRTPLQKYSLITNVNPCNKTETKRKRLNPSV